MSNGDATTQYYGWVKPTVGGDVDNWGGILNADLDAIDSVMNTVQTTAVGDAPSDGNSYMRCNGVWVSVIDAGTF